MAEIHHFAYGWINPVLAYVLASLGWLLGLLLMSQAHAVSGASRLRLVALSSVAIGGVGAWLPQFMAMLGFEVADASVRYDVAATVGSLVLVVASAAVGLYLAAREPASAWRRLLAGAIVGAGMAAMHSMGVDSVRFAGRLGYDPVPVVVAVTMAVVIATTTLWFIPTLESRRAMVCVALLVGGVLTSAHYVAMFAVNARLVEVDGMLSGVAAIVMLTPVSIVACIVISLLAFVTVGFAVHQENVAEEAVLARARSTYAASLASLAGPQPAVALPRQAAAPAASEIAAMNRSWPGPNGAPNGAARTVAVLGGVAARADAAGAAGAPVTWPEAWRDANDARARSTRPGAPARPARATQPPSPRHGSAGGRGAVNS